MADNQKDKERLKKALDSMIFLPHLKDRQAQSVLAALMPEDKGPRATGRPWDKADLFRRLKTFKPSTWFAKPDAISAQECARRGWLNTDADVITCEACQAVVSCPIPMQLLPDEAQKVAEKYAKQISEAHAVACPWRSAACSPSLLKFPHLPKSAVSLDFEERAATMNRLLCLPPLASEALETLTTGPLGASAAKIIETGPETAADAALSTSTQTPLPQLSSQSAAALSSGTATCDQEAFKRRLRAIVLCGWSLEALSAAAAATSEGHAPCHLGPESAMLACTLCGAKAGLWASFPECQPQASPSAPIPMQRNTVTTPINTTKTTSINALELRSHPLRSSFGSPPSGGGGGGALHRHVAVNVATSIAGGTIAAAGMNDGGNLTAAPFGSGAAAPAFGGGGSVGPFGSPPSRQAAASVAATPPAHPAQRDSASGAAVAQSSSQAADSIPVFGFAALRAAEPGSTAALLQKSAAKRMRDDAFWEAALAGDKRPRGEERRTSNGTAGKGTAVADGNVPPPPPGSKMTAAGAPQPPPSQAVLQKYRSMRSTPLDPIALHRLFCPWVHGTAQGAGEPSSTGALCGWQWYAQQLVGSEGAALRETTAVAAAVLNEDDESNGGGDSGSRFPWNPAAVLRNALAKVEVKKS